MPWAPPQRRFDSGLPLLAQVTKQTGPAGKPVNTLYIASKLDLAKEMYFAILLDRKSAGTMIIACGEGKPSTRARGDWSCVSMPSLFEENSSQNGEGLSTREVGFAPIQPRSA